MQPASAAVGLIVVAAGSGSRLGADVPKAFVPLAGVPLLGHALRGALSCPDIGELVVVAPDGWLAQAREIGDAVCRWAGSHASLTIVPASPPSSERVPGSAGTSREQSPTIRVVAGGAERGDSVAAGLAALSESVEVVLVHDAARCLTPPTVFERVIRAVRSGAVAVVPGVAVVDTIKQVDESGQVVGTPERASLRAVQTPQGFRRDVLERAHSSSGNATDDAGLVERLGEPVLVVEGDPSALKITTTEDLDRAARLLTG